MPADARRQASSTTYDHLPSEGVVQPTYDHLASEASTTQAAGLNTASNTYDHLPKDTASKPERRPYSHLHGQTELDFTPTQPHFYSHLHGERSDPNPTSSQDDYAEPSTLGTKWTPQSAPQDGSLAVSSHTGLVYEAPATAVVDVSGEPPLKPSEYSNVDANTLASITDGLDPRPRTGTVANVYEGVEAGEHVPEHADQVQPDARGAMPHAYLVTPVARVEPGPTAPYTAMALDPVPASIDGMAESLVEAEDSVSEMVETASPVSLSPLQSADNSCLNDGTERERQDSRDAGHAELDTENAENADADNVDSSIVLSPRARLESLSTGVRVARASMRAAAVDVQTALVAEAAQLPSYAGDVPRARTELVLTGMPSGTYLLRTSQRSLGVVLSVLVGPGQCMHAILKRAANNLLLLNDKPLPQALTTLPTTLVAFSSDPQFLGVVLTSSLRNLLESQVSDDDYVHPVTCSRQDAEALLKGRGRVGGFLLRRRQQAGSFGLSVLTSPDVVAHHLLRKTSHGFSVNDNVPLARISTLSMVVEGLKERRFNLKGSFTELVLPTNSTDS
jgi:hypothetical protein